ncbi:MAG: undecaprenyl-diphosphatase UppP [Candidatus Omnitrophica bacterium]|nr:undecaprenyl-diphosphatase UppP [Candidatus Omnitrophota bacterium]
MDITHTIILAVIEGVTEFLPVSSTGHMMVASALMHMPQTEFLKTFEIAIQLGAIAAVAGLYWRTFLLDWEIDARVLASFVPTAIVGFLLYKFIKKSLLGNAWVVVWAWFIGGVMIVLFERFYPSKGHVKQISQISFPKAILIGIFQALAVVPGVSRSAATILGGLMLGVERRAIVEFSFLLAVPTMLAATVLDLIKTDATLNSNEWGLLGVGFLVAFIVAWGAVKFLLQYIQRHNFTPFGVYRILAALAAGFLLNS